MQQYLDELIEWTHENDMEINSKKTKEIMMGSINVSDLPPLCTKAGQIQQVHSFKFLNCSGICWRILDLELPYQYITAKVSGQIKKKVVGDNTEAPKASRPCQRR